MLTGIFIYTLPKLDEKESHPQDPLFAACLQADIQQLHGCSTIPDLFGKIESFCCYHKSEEYQLLAIIPAGENLTALLREIYPHIKLIFWGRELASDDFFKRWQALTAGRYHDMNDIEGFVQTITFLINGHNKATS